MNFGQAIEALKAGDHVTRFGWNGKGMWLALVYKRVGAGGASDAGGSRVRRPWIGMRTVDNEWVPWTASQTDVLAEDWETNDAPE